jgi:hypothetical protein
VSKNFGYLGQLLKNTRLLASCVVQRDLTISTFYDTSIPHDFCKNTRLWLFDPRQVRTPWKLSLVGENDHTWPHILCTSVYPVMTCLLDPCENYACNTFFCNYRMTTCDLCSSAPVNLCFAWMYYTFVTTFRIPCQQCLVHLRFHLLYKNATQHDDLQDLIFSKNLSSQINAEETNKLMQFLSVLCM